MGNTKGYRLFFFFLPISLSKWGADLKVSKIHLHLNKLCVDYYRLQKGSHIHVFQNTRSKRKWDSPDPANRHVLSLYSSRTILCVNREKKGNLSLGEVLLPSLWYHVPQQFGQRTYSQPCIFKNRIICILFHLLFPFYFFHVNVLKQLNLQAILLAQR